MKNRLLKKAFPWVIGILTPLIGQAVMAAVSKLPEGLLLIVDPYAITAAIMSLVVGGLAYGLAKWTKTPVAEWQATLKAAGKYHGRVDGEWGPLTDEATIEAVNDPQVKIRPARVIRPAGGKIGT